MTREAWVWWAFVLGSAVALTGYGFVVVHLSGAPYWWLPAYPVVGATIAAAPRLLRTLFDL